MKTRRIRRNRISENRKVTLTFGQLKRLVTENKRIVKESSINKKQIQKDADWICQFLINLSDFVYLEAFWDGDELILREQDENESSSPPDDVRETAAVIARITNAKDYSDSEEVDGRYQCRLTY